MRTNWGTFVQGHAYSEVMKKILSLSLGLLSFAGAQTTTSTTPTTLQLTAPVGSIVELRTVNTSRMTVSDIQVTAKPGGKASPAQVEEARRAMQDGLGAMNKAGTTTVNGKAFYKVAGRDAAGNITLINSIVQTMPATAGKKAENLTIRITQVISPDGQASGLKMESDQPQVNAMFKNLTPEKLQQMTKDMSGNDQSIYTMPLQQGTPRTTTVSLDMQDLMNTLIGSLAGPKAGALFGSINSTPLTITSTTNYQGLNAAGQHAFTTSSEAADWKLSLSSQDKSVPMNIKAEILSNQSSGTSTYATTGLPVTLDQKTNMNMKMTMEMDDIQVSMIMTIDQTMTMQPK